MLREQVYDKEFSVIPKKDFFPYLHYDEREKWDNANNKIRKLVCDRAKVYKNFDYPLITATDYMECFRSGNRTAQEDKYFARREALATLVLAECFEARGEYLDDIINGIWCICEETSWVVAAHNFIYEKDPANSKRTLPDVDMQMLDIFASETAMLLTMTNYLLKKQLDKIEPLVSRRISRELKKRIIDPFINRYDYWWMGYSERRDINNWGPWCVVNCLTCVLFEEPEDDIRKRAVVRAMDMLDRYLEGISEDGGCDEGATYWGRACGMLLEGLNLVYYATKGAINVFSEKKIQNFTDYIRKMYISGDFVVNFADGSARYNPASEIVYIAGIRMNNKQIANFGAYLFKYQLDKGVFPITALTRALLSIEYADERLAKTRKLEFETDIYIESLQILVSRECSTPEKGFFICTKGGHNNDSHNHNDVGNFVLFYNGKPIIIDVGVEVYKKHFFSEARYTIWTMQSAYHNLPTINGVMQHNGSEYRAENVVVDIGDEQSSISMDITKAYPHNAGVDSYRRTVMLDRNTHTVHISEEYQLSKTESLNYSFMTACEPTLCNEGIQLTYNDDTIIMYLDHSRFDIKIEKIEISDKKLYTSWGDHIYRLYLTIKELKSQGNESFIFAGK